MWKKIWNGVYKLNKQILNDKHNLSYESIIKTVDTDPKKLDWILKYNRAMIHKITEFLDECDDHKSKIELIDVLFFLVGVIQLVGFSSSYFKETMIEIKQVIRDHEEYYPEELLFCAITLEDQVAWKHWKTYKKGITSDFITYLKRLINEWWRQVECKKMTDNIILNAFNDKLKVNYKRQENGYTMKQPDDDIHVRTT